PPLFPYTTLFRSSLPCRFLAAPHDLDRNAGIPFGNRHHDTGIVTIDTPAKTAADKGLVNFYVFGRDPCFLHSDGENLLGMLRWRPDFGAVLGDQRGAVEGLHRHLLAIGREVFSLDDRATLG